MSYDKLVLDAYLSQDAYWQINKQVVKIVGIESALLLSDLYSKWKYFNCPEWFFNTIENVENDTTLNRHAQEKCINKLIEIGFIEMNRNTIGGKRQFKINTSQIVEILKSRMLNSDNLECENLAIQNEKISQSHIIRIKGNKNKEIRINNNSLSALENSDSLEVENGNSKRKKVAPKKEKVIEDAIEVLDYLNELRQKHLGVKRGYSATKSNLNFITARLSENNTIQDLKDVIQLKVWQWKKDVKMSVYLRPETLFNPTKFYSYIQEVEQAKNNPNYATEYKQSKQGTTSKATNSNGIDPNKLFAILDSIPNIK